MSAPIIIIGLGSMGKRRIRNLLSLGFKNIIGFDLRQDRVNEVVELYSVKCYTLLEDALKHFPFKAMIISVPPDVHHIYMNKSIELNIPFFVEASVVDHEMDSIINKAKEKNVFAAPSSTLYFHPAIKKIFELINNNYLGKISNVMYHMGNYLPDWHQYEKVSEFYVSKRETGGAREIVPFELTWITKLFGFPKQVVSTVKKTIEIEGATDIDDTYNCILDYSSFTIVLTVDVVTRNSTRRLFINGALRQLEWDWNLNYVKVYHPDKNEWEFFSYETLSAADGYNKNITEQMYVDELNSFLNGIKDPNSYVNSLEDDLKVLKLLYKIEDSYKNKTFTAIE